MYKRQLTLEKLITSAITLVICILVIWIVMRIARRISAHSRLSESLSRFILKVLKIALEFMAILIVADSLGFNVTALLAVFSLLGLALSLSVQNCLSNAMSGITILLTRPFEDGDFIEAGDVSGTVKDARWIIRTFTCRTATSRRPRSSIITASCSGAWT